MGFAVDNVQLALAMGEMTAVKQTLGRLQSYSIFAGVLLFDEDLTPLMSIRRILNLQIHSLSEWSKMAKKRRPRLPTKGRSQR